MRGLGRFLRDTLRIGNLRAVWACRMGPDGPVDPAWRVDMGFGTAHGRSRKGPRCLAARSFSILTVSRSFCRMPHPASCSLAVARVTPPPHYNLSLDFGRASRSKIGHLTPACVFVLVSLCLPVWLVRVFSLSS
jgi:hypothetical protein